MKDKNYTFIVSNGRKYSDHTLYFVVAPADFEKWLSDVLVPWLRERHLMGADMKVVGRCPEVEWRKIMDMRSMSYQEFLTDDLRVEELDYDENPPARRPTYRGA